MPRSWFKVDSQLPEHAKLDGLSTNARMHLMGTLLDIWAYCRRNPTDGYVPAPRWHRLGSTLGRRLAIERGFAVEKPSGYEIHDWRDHQTARADSQRFRELANRRWDAQRKAKQDAERNAAPHSDALSDAQMHRREEKREEAYAPEVRTPTSSVGSPARPAPAAPPKGGGREPRPNHPPPIGALCPRCGRPAHPADDTCTGMLRNQPATEDATHYYAGQARTGIAEALAAKAERDRQALKQPPPPPPDEQPPDDF